MKSKRSFQGFGAIIDNSLQFLKKDKEYLKKTCSLSKKAAQIGCFSVFARI